MNNNYQVRPAILADKQEIANLMFFEKEVHRHLDWKHPTEWLGEPLYWVLERNNRIMAVLACPQDRDGLTWIRLFAHLERFPLQEAWDTLWSRAKKDIEKKGDTTVFAVTLKTWMQRLLKNSNFSNNEHILMMSWQGKEMTATAPNKEITVREMTKSDLPNVAAVDTEAFSPLWQNSLSILEQAHTRAILPSIAETSEGIVGYQISTPSPYGAHLARLAVHPKAQRKGVASALITKLITELLAKNITQLSVSTQSKNDKSIAFYTKIGFKHTEEKYPLYSFQIGKEQIKELL